MILQTHRIKVGHNLNAWSSAACRNVRGEEFLPFIVPTCPMNGGMNIFIDLDTERRAVDVNGGWPVHSLRTPAGAGDAM